MKTRPFINSVPTKADESDLVELFFAEAHTPDKDGCMKLAGDGFAKCLAEFFVSQLCE